MPTVPAAPAGDGAAPLPERVEEVLDVVDAIPAGHVLTYGDVGQIVGDRGPRFVGTVLRRYGGGSPWWRVLRADGSAAPPLAPAAVAHWRAEATPLRRAAADPADVRVDLALARWRGPVADPPHAPAGTGAGAGR